MPNFKYKPKQYDTKSPFKFNNEFERAHFISCKLWNIFYSGIVNDRPTVNAYCEKRALVKLHSSPFAKCFSP